MDGVLGKKQYRIGAEIPPVRYITVELEMLIMEYAAYVCQHERNNQQRGGFGATEDNTDEIRNMTVHRSSCLAVLSIDLKKVDYANNGAVSLEKLYLNSHKHGATFFHEATKADPTECKYIDRLGLAGYITRKSAKLRILSGLIYETCVE